MHFIKSGIIRLLSSESVVDEIIALIMFENVWNIIKLYLTFGLNYFCDYGTHVNMKETRYLSSGSDSRNWRSGNARSLSPGAHGDRGGGAGSGFRGSRRSRGRGRWNTVNGGPRLTATKFQSTELGMYRYNAYV